MRRELERMILNGVVLGASLISGTCIGKAVTNITDSKSIGIASGVSVGTIVCSAGACMVETTVDKKEDQELIEAIEKKLKEYSSTDYSSSECRVVSHRILQDIEMIHNEDLRNDYHARLDMLNIKKMK